MAVDYILVRTESVQAEPADELLRVEQLGAATGLHADLVRRLWRMGLFDAERLEAGEPVFGVPTIFRVRRALRLRRDLGVSWLSLGLVADLLERVDTLESRVRALETLLDRDITLDPAA